MRELLWVLISMSSIAVGTAVGLVAASLVVALSTLH